jgi:acyl-coenzyme A thioesterase PaaI-like protein
MNVAALPFSRLIGLQEASVGGRSAISLEPQDQHRNHVGTIHAAVAFSVAEAASAQALLAAFPQFAETATAVLRSVRLKYKRPATGAIYATASVDDAAAQACRARFESKGLALVNVAASVFQDNVELLSGRFTWCVLRKEQA